MRKILLFVLLALTTVSSRAALYINNNTTSQIVLRLHAHDVNNPASCAYYSTRLNIDANYAGAYNNVTNLNAPGGPGWYLPSSGAIMVTTGSGWDAATVWWGTLGQIGIIGPGSCATSGNTVTATIGSTTITVTWTPLPGGNVLIDIS